MADICECFEGDRQAVVMALLEPANLQRYSDYLTGSVGGLAEQSDLALGKRCQHMVSTIYAYGWEAARENDEVGLDLMLTDAFAVATWESWKLPITSLGRREVAVADQFGGLLRTGDHGASVALFALDDDILALQRGRRQASDVVLRADKHW